MSSCWAGQCTLTRLSRRPIIANGRPRDVSSAAWLCRCLCAAIAADPWLDSGLQAQRLQERLTISGYTLNPVSYCWPVD